MKKPHKILAVVFAFVLSCSVLVGCGGRGKQQEPLDLSVLDAVEGFTAPNYGYTYYDNFQFNQFYNPEESAEHLPNQWTFGMGNAFVLRHNGMYYMYMNGDLSTPALPAWKSADLMVWEEVDNGVLAKGHIIEDARVSQAYPPAVYYYDGTFYMHIYLKNGNNNLPGEGNYILSSQSPEGPFSFVDKNGDGVPDLYAPDTTLTDIDSDIFVDDDGTTWFMSAASNAIRIHKMGYAMDEILYGEGNTWLLDQTGVGGHTEGSGMFKRDGKYYIGYTGSDILSPGYMTAYSAATDDSWKTPEQNIGYGFEEGLDWPLGMRTDTQFRGLGHFSSLLGPDMDGLYYHYFNVNSAGPNCSFNIDRLIFNGTGMDAPQLQYGSVTPRLPEIRSYDPTEDFSAQGEALLSAQATGAAFTAEFNYVGNGVRCVVGYRDAQNYWYVTTDLAGKTVKLYEVAGGTVSEKGCGQLNRPYTAGNVETVRVAYRDGKADVYFADLCKIDDAAVTISAGKIGYIGSADRYEYTAASNVAQGASDQLEPKHYSINIGAASYLPVGLIEGHGSRLGDGSGYSETTAADYEGKQVGLGRMTLANFGDSATFVVGFDESRTGGASGLYGLQVMYPATEGGKRIGVRVDGGKVYPVSLPVVAPTEKSPIIKATITEIPIAEGIRQISLVGLEDDVTFHSLSFTKTAGQMPAYEATLASSPAQGMEVMTLWRYQAPDDDTTPALYSATNRALAYFGDDTLSDFTVEVELRFDGDPGIDTAGIIVRSNNYSNSAYAAETYEYIQGYYVGLNTMDLAIEKLNFTHTNTLASFRNVDLATDVWHKLQVSVRGNTISVTVTSAAGEVTKSSFTDSIGFSAGRFGLYTAGASVYYRNLKISA